MRETMHEFGNQRGKIKYIETVKEYVKDEIQKLNL